MRVYILVEGQTEERFVKDVLVPHLGALAVWVYPIVVATRRDRRTGQKSRGGGHWNHWLKDMRRLVGEHSGNEVRFTTLFDLYGLPDDFPRLDALRSERDTSRRAQQLEEAMGEAAGDWRVVPYLQRHEFETLVLACLDQLRSILDPSDHAGLDQIKVSLASMKPEEVDDGEATAPSKRLGEKIAGYDKRTHGPLAIESAGLRVVRAECPRFDGWLRKLESLSPRM